MLPSLRTRLVLSLKFVLAIGVQMASPLAAMPVAHRFALQPRGVPAKAEAVLAVPFRLPLIGCVKVLEPVQLLLELNRLEFDEAMSFRNASFWVVAVESTKKRCRSPLVRKTSPACGVVGETPLAKFKAG